MLLIFLLLKTVEFGRAGDGADFLPYTFCFDSLNRKFKITDTAERLITRDSVTFYYGKKAGFTIYEGDSEYILSKGLKITGFHLTDVNFLSPEIPGFGTVYVDPLNGRFKFSPIKLWQIQKIDTSNLTTEDIIIISNKGLAFCAFSKTSAKRARFDARRYTIKQFLERRIKSPADFLYFSEKEDTWKTTLIIQGAFSPALSLKNDTLILNCIYFDGAHYVVRSKLKYKDNWIFDGIISYTNYDVLSHSLSQDFCVFTQYDSVFSPNLYFARFTGSWGDYQMLDSAYIYQPCISKNGNLAICTYLKKVGLYYRVFSCFYSDTWSSPFLIDAGTKDAISPLCVADTLSFCVFCQYDTKDTLAVYAVTFEGGGYSPPYRLSQRGIISQNPDICVRGKKAICVWEGYVADTLLAIFGAVYDNGWTQPEIISGDISSSCYNPKVEFKSDGNAICVFQKWDGCILKIMGVEWSGEWGSIFVIGDSNSKNYDFTLNNVDDIFVAYSDSFCFVKWQESDIPKREVFVSYSFNVPPILLWTGEQGFENDGVEEIAENKFLFKVKYFDEDNNLPQKCLLQIDLDGDNLFESSESFEMTKDTGWIYCKELEISDTGTYFYKFHFEDYCDTASGEPALPHAFTNIVIMENRKALKNEKEIYDILGRRISKSIKELPSGIYFIYDKKTLAKSKIVIIK